MKNAIIAFVIIFFSHIVSAQQPKLVVEIVVDGLQQQYIEHLWDNLSPNGFKHFVGQGAVVNNLCYNTIPAGKIVDIANAMTGSVPYYHGITGKDYYNRLDDQTVSILYDPEQIGIGVHEGLSAYHLLSTTLSDELMLQYPNKSKTYVVSIDADAAIMLGGHTANGVAWLEDTFNRWNTTAYYNEGLSRWADQMNIDDEITRAVNRIWRPLLSYDNYTEYQAGNTSSFRYVADKNRSLLKISPAANSLVTKLALATFNGENLGADNFPDLLLLQYSVKTLRETTFAAETEDMYFCLDRDLQTLIQTINDKIGEENVLYCLFSAPKPLHSPQYLEKNNIASGVFSTSRSMALLNVYLMAIYGQERWVTGYNEKNIFLNREKADERRVNIVDMQQRVATFMLEFAGVQSAFTAEQLLRTNYGGDGVLARLQNSINHRTAGDVIITLQPGWVEVVDEDLNYIQPSNIATFAPAYFCGWNVKQQTINKQYNITDIAPTICNILKINYPNACIGKAIEEIVK
ncbi:MAG: alkaline phosphatase family protein [Paludibacter sp.]|jgi:hypothetical protein|nr:alkaline phosphatase family protein [Paludibacter sp.]